MLLLPFGTKLAQLATVILPEKPSEEPQPHKLVFIKPVDVLSDAQMGNSAITINGIQQELDRMAGMVRQNVDASFQAVLEGRPTRLPAVEETEEYIDYLNKEISKYISKVIAYEQNAQDSALISSYLKITNDLERIGDHAINICEYTQTMEREQLMFSESAQEEIRQMRETSLRAMDVLHGFATVTVEQLTKASAVEQQIDDMTVNFRKHQLERLHQGTCSGETCILYSEMLTDFERIGDHMLNISRALAAPQLN